MSQTVSSPKVLMMPDYHKDNPYQSLLAQSLEQNGVQVLFPRGYHRVFPIFRAVRDESRINILHLHWLGTYLKGRNQVTRLIYAIKFLTDILLLRFSGICVVWTIRNQLEHEYPSPQLDLWVRKILSSWCDAVILHNHLTLKLIADSHRFSSLKAYIIPHGHYRGVYGSPVEQTTARNILGLPLKGRIYLHLGMLRPYKGIELLVQTWESLHPYFSEHTLLIAGLPLDDDYRHFLKGLIEGAGNIIFRPEFIQDEQIHLFFSAADVVVLPFKDTLTSGSTILAMSYEKPIIAPRLGSIPEILGNGYPLLYDDEASNGLASALQKSLSYNLQKLNLQTVEACDMLGWESIGRKTIQIYHKCILRQKRFRKLRVIFSVGFLLTLSLIAFKFFPPSAHPCKGHCANKSVLTTQLRAPQMNLPLGHLGR